MKNQGLDEILFEDREKRYGAYAVRLSYSRNLLFGFVLVSFGTFLLVTIPKVLAKNAEKHKMETIINVTELPNNPLPKEEKPIDIPKPPEPEVPKTPEIPQKVNTIAFNIPKPTPVEKMVEEKVIVENKVLDTAVVSTKTVTDGANVANKNFIPNEEGDKNGKGAAIKKVIEEPEPVAKKEIPKVDNSNTIPSSTVFIAAQKKPEPVNMNDIRALIVYPALAVEGTIEGDVTLKILVDEEGKYMQHIVLKQIHPLLLKEVEKHVSKLRFTPAIQGGKPIKFWLVVPFKFELKG